MYSGQTRSIHFLGQVAVESHEGSEEPTIDQVCIMGRPDRRPDQGENVEFFLSQINFFLSHTVLTDIVGELFVIDKIFSCTMAHSQQ